MSGCERGQLGPQETSSEERRGTVSPADQGASVEPHVEPLAGGLWDKEAVVATSGRGQQPRPNRRVHTHRVRATPAGALYCRSNEVLEVPRFRQLDKASESRANS